MLNLYRFHSQPQQLMGYADVTTKIPEFAWEAAITVAQKRKLQHVWAQYPEWAHRYARDVIKGPWPPGEAAIAGSAEYAFRYARDMVRKPWPPGEAAIASVPYLAYLYARTVIKGPWPPGEAAIAGSAEWAQEYQKKFKVNLHA